MIFEGLHEHLPRYNIRRITNNDLEDLYNFQLTNPEYFSYIQEHEVTMEECIEGTKALPPGTCEDQKFYIGFYRDSNLEVIMDIIIDYPDKGIAWIGLLMVDGNLRRKGLGLFLDVIEFH